MEKYGTHLVTQYSTGALLSFGVMADSQLFTLEEVEALQRHIFWGDTTLSQESWRKALQHRKDIGILYRHRGSNRPPQQTHLQPESLFQGSQPTEKIDQRIFRKQINWDSHTFLRLGYLGTSIPNLISNLPLKVKYICGILDKIRPADQQGTDYLLCDPASYKVIRKNSIDLRIHMDSYTGAEVTIFRGSTKTINDPLDGEQVTRWQAEIDMDGLWTFKKVGTDRYFCRDLQVRTSAEDTKGFRFWALNPFYATKIKPGAKPDRALVRRF